MKTFEVKKYSAEDLEFHSPSFENAQDGYSELKMIDCYGSIFPRGLDKNPTFFFRHGNADSYRWGGFVELGPDGPLDVQRGEHHDDIAQGNTPVTQYKRISDNPVAYRWGTEEPFSEYTYYEDHVTIKEGDFCDLVGKPFPFTFFNHRRECNSSPMWTQPMFISGTYNGKFVEGCGHYDRIFVPNDAKYTSLVDSFAYIALQASAIREDGRREAFYASVDGSGKTCGIYMLEGEEPVYSDEVVLKAEWQHLPYCDDGTCVATEEVWYLGDKEIHMQGKWGTKGFTATPRIDRHGQSHCFGYWWEGKTPYRHRVFNTMCENMEVYDYALEKLGFKVID